MQRCVAGVKNNSAIKLSVVPKIIFVLLLSMWWAAPVSADVSPAGCTGSGLGINLFTSLAQVNLGDTISYSVVVFNGLPGVPIVCDATGIQASIVTPDGVNHPISLVRTALSDGESDFYPNVVTYVAQVADMTPEGTLVTTTSDTGTIHQNITNSIGGGNQSLNVYVLNTLHIIKQVINNDTGTTTVSGFNLHVKNAGVDVLGSPVVGTTSPGTLYSLIAGTYVVSEDTNPLYTQSFSGDCDATGTVTLVGAEDKTCTVTNNDIPTASINVVKVVVNDNGGTKVISDFPLFVSGTPVVSGATNIFPAPASYTVTETGNATYSTTFSGDCDASGNVTLVPGENKFCIITNNDIAPPVIVTPPGGGGGSSMPPLIDVVKVPNPLALPGGPGPVTYTYTLTNIGTVPVNGITMIGDTCSPIIRISGDTDSDDRLDLDETWVYQCTTTLVATHTNIVTATGWANGISTSDIASATVIVGVPGLPDTGVVPPLIHVTKVPTPLAFSVGGGMVTYTLRVSNPGVVALSNVLVNDDKCAPVRYVLGDLDGDSELDTNETWLYYCTMRLDRTTTNTVIVEGTANGIRARDLAIATVVVAIPRLPNTALDPEANISWPIVAGVLIMFTLLFQVVRMKHNAIENY